MAKIILTSKEDIHANMCASLISLRNHGDSTGILRILEALSKTRHKRKIIQWFEKHSLCKFQEENGGFRITNKPENRKLIDTEEAHNNPYYKSPSIEEPPKTPPKELASTKSLEAKSARIDIENKLQEFFKNPDEEKIASLTILMQSYERRTKISSNNQGVRAAFFQGGAPGLGKRS